MSSNCRRLPVPLPISSTFFSSATQTFFDHKGGPVWDCTVFLKTFFYWPTLSKIRGGQLKKHPYIFSLFTGCVQKITNVKQLSAPLSISSTFFSRAWLGHTSGLVLFCVQYFLSETCLVAIKDVPQKARITKKIQILETYQF